MRLQGATAQKRGNTMYTMLNPNNICGVTLIVNGTAYTYEAHSLNMVASILGATQALEGAKIDAVTINYFNA
jgi:hypothetical protein